VVETSQSGTDGEPIADSPREPTPTNLPDRQMENVLLHNVDRQLSPKKRIRHYREQSAVFIVHARHVIVVCRQA
jgi:hypothetical protein